ncbi:MAG: HAD-IA family hydrolase [Myxococcota bacterium]
MTDFVLLDLDGVLRHWDPTHVAQAERERGVAVGTMYAQAFAPEQLEPAIRGVVTHQAWQASVEAALVDALGADVAHHLVEAWRTCPFEMDRSLYQAVRTLASPRGLVLVTNATTALGDDLRRAGFGEAFDAVFNSSAMGVVKPSGEFFERVLSALAREASDVVYVDDTKVNVSAARELGIRAHRHRTPEGTLEFLRQSLS